MIRNFRTLLALILVALAMLPVLFVTFPFSSLVSSTVERTADREIALISQSLARDLQSDMRMLVTQAQALSRDSDIQRGTRSILFAEKAAFLMRRFLDDNTLAGAAYLIDESFRVNSESRATSAASRPSSSNRELVLELLKKKLGGEIPDARGYYRIYGSGGSYFLALPVEGPLERPTGLLAVEIEGRALQEAVAARVEKPTVARLVLNDSAETVKEQDERNFRHEAPVLIGGFEPGQGLAMRIVVLEPKAIRLSAVRGTVRWMLASAIVLALIAGALGYYLAYRLNRPFKYLNEHLKRYEAGEYDAPVPVFAIDEFKLIARTMNSMAGKITAQIQLAAENERVRGEVQRTRLETELHSLHQQMQPHFLFNMLNTIGMMIHLDPDRAAQLVNKFAELYRLILEMSRTNTVPLEKELTVVSHYLELQQVRFGERLRYGIHCEPELKTLHIPGLMLQTLVENAVKHGIAKAREGGEIQVRILRASNGQYRCEIVNSTGRMTGEPPGKGTGLENTRRRLSLLYGDAHGFSLSSEEGNRTVASFYFSGRAI